MPFDRRLMTMVAAALITACAPQVTLRVQDFGSGDERLELSKTAFFPSTDRGSAAAALATLLYTDGLTTVGTGQVAPLLGKQTPVPALRAEMLDLARRFGRLPFVLPPTLNAVLAEVRSGQPVLVFQQLDGGRYSVVVGVDPMGNRMILRSGKDGRVYQPVDEFVRRWKGGDAWAMTLNDGNRVPASATQEAWIAAGEAATAAGYPELAEKGAVAAIARWPNAVVPWVALGNARYAMKQWQTAQDAYVEALKRKPENPVVRNNLALVLLERRCISLAEEQLQRAIRGETDPRLLETYDNTRALINRYSGTAIYCPPPDDASAPIEYEIAPLNPETPRAPPAPRRAPSPPKR